MRLRASILRNIAVPAAALAAASCRVVDDDVAEGCPHCGDPVTVDAPGGARVLPRLRLPPPDEDPLGSAIRWLPFAEGRDGR